MAEAIGLKMDDPRFWDPADLRGEVDRIFDICWQLSALLQVLRQLSDAVRADRRQDRERPRADTSPRTPSWSRRPTRSGARRPAGRAGSTSRRARCAVTFGDELPELHAHAARPHRRRDRPGRRPLLPVQALLPELSRTRRRTTTPLDFPRLLLRWKAQRTRARRACRCDAR